MRGLDDQRLLAAVTFPAEWRAVANLPGETGRRKRAALRKRAAAQSNDRSTS